MRSGEDAMFELLVGILFGFGCGYGVREAISRRRRAIALREALLREEAAYKKDFDDRVKLMGALQRTLVKN
jgi:hypothetical protein